PVYAFQPNVGGLLSMLLTLILPLLVGVVTTRVTSPTLKTILLLIATAIKTTAEAIVANNNDYIHFAWIPFLMNLVLNLILAIGMYFGVWKPTKIADRVQDRVGVTEQGYGIYTR